MRKGKSFILILLEFLFYIVEYFFPKKSNLILFSQSNERYSDNSKALFEYMLKNSDYQVIWLYHIKRPKEEDYFIKMYSIKGLIYALQGKIFVISHGLGDVGLYKRNSKSIIQLWHGISIKNLGILDCKLSSLQIEKFLKYETSRYDFFLSSSKIESYFLSSAMKISYKNIFISGLPRNDFLVNFEYSQTTLRDNKLVWNLLNNKKVILYAPTFRDFDETDFFPFLDFSADKLSNILKKNGATLLVRPHLNDFKNKKVIFENFKDYENINLVSEEELKDVNELLPFVDVIITDYSSIYIDLLLRDIPVIFIPYDLEKYEKVRGLAYDYYLITPGPKVFTQKEFLIAIDDALKGAVLYKERRKFIKKIFHQYDDGRACERVTKMIGELL